jgi:peptidoglycan/LPS O-acetylase OafA/YrhL
MSSPQKSDISYRPDIDGLRALAVLSTIAFHCYPKIFTNGYVSVDVFFVISGFLITSIILTQLVNKEFSLINFYARRVKRILPPSLLVLGAITLTGILTLFTNEFYSLKSYIGPAAGFYINFKLIKDTSYFAFESNFKPLLHFWSLAVEEQFYVFWPMYFTLVYKFARKRFTDLSNTLLVLAGATAVVLIPSLIYLLISAQDLYFSSFGRVWELMMGGMAAIVYYWIKNSPETHRQYLKYSNALSVTGFAFLSVSLFCERTFTIIFGVIGGFFLVVSSENSFGKSFLKSKVMVYLGLISFSTYLWHWPILSFYHMYAVVISPVEMAFLIALIYILSALTYHLVEKPLKDKNWDPYVFGGKFNYKKLIPITACLLVSVFFLTANIKKLPDKQTSELIYREDTDVPLNSKCALTATNGNNDFLQKWCYSQNTMNPEQGLIIGDSQAHVLYRSMVTVSEKVSWHLVSSEGCSPFLLPTMTEECKRLVTESFANIEKFPEIRHVVFMTANQIYNHNRQAFDDPAIQSQIKTTLARLNAQNRTVYIVRPYPEFLYNISSCSRQRFSFYKAFDTSKYCRMDKSSWLHASDPYNSFLDKLKTELPFIKLIDSTNIMCDQSECVVSKNGKTLYQDTSHLSYEGNLRLSESILKSM